MCIIWVESVIERILMPFSSRINQIEAGLGGQHGEQPTFKLEYPKIAELSERMTQLCQDFVELQIFVQGFNEDPVFNPEESFERLNFDDDPEFKLNIYLNRIEKFKDKLIKLYPETNDQEGGKIIDWLTYMGTVMMPQLGQDKRSYLTELPQKNKNNKEN